LSIRSRFRRSSSALAHRLLNALGIQVRLVRNLKAARIAELRDREFDAWRKLASHPFRCILDVGANEGQFAEIARRLWPDADIHSFEPLPDVHAALSDKFRHDPKVFTHPFGLSDSETVQRMHRSAFSPSSSLLPMAQLHRAEWPQSVEHTDVDVRLERMDVAVLPLLGAQHVPMLVKIDVQGFEMSVINGGVDTLRRATHVVVEVSFHELYEGQPLFAEIHDRLRALGFAYRGHVEQYASKDGTRVLYADAIFENTGISANE
jgi:FkbM family methyltransferase